MMSFILAINHIDKDAHKNHNVMAAFESAMQSDKNKTFIKYDSSIDFVDVTTEHGASFTAYMIKVAKFAFIMMSYEKPSNKIHVTQYMTTIKDDEESLPIEIYSHEFMIQSYESTCGGLIKAIDQCLKDNFASKNNLL